MDTCYHKHTGPACWYGGPDPEGNGAGTQETTEEIETTTKMTLSRMDPDKYYTREEVMEALGCSLSALYKYFKDGLDYSAPGKQRYVKGCALTAYLDRKQVTRRKRA